MGGGIKAGHRIVCTFEAVPADSDGHAAVEKCETGPTKAGARGRQQRLTHFPRLAYSRGRKKQKLRSHQSSDGEMRERESGRGNVMEGM